MNTEIFRNLKDFAYVEAVASLLKTFRLLLSLEEQKKWIKLILKLLNEPELTSLKNELSLDTDPFYKKVADFLLDLVPGGRDDESTFERLKWIASELKIRHTHTWPVRYPLYLEIISFFYEKDCLEEVLKQIDKNVGLSYYDEFKDPNDAYLCVHCVKEGTESLYTTFLTAFLSLAHELGISEIRLYDSNQVLELESQAFESYLAKATLKRLKLYVPLNAKNHSSSLLSALGKYQALEGLLWCGVLVEANYDNLVEIIQNNPLNFLSFSYNYPSLVSKNPPVITHNPEHIERILDLIKLIGKKGTVKTFEWRENPFFDEAFFKKFIGNLFDENSQITNLVFSVSSFNREWHSTLVDFLLSNPNKIEKIFLVEAGQPKVHKLDTVLINFKLQVPRFLEEQLARQSKVEVLTFDDFYVQMNNFIRDFVRAFSVNDDYRIIREEEKGDACRKALDTFIKKGFQNLSDRKIPDFPIVANASKNKMQKYDAGFLCDILKQDVSGVIKTLTLKYTDQLSDDKSSLSSSLGE
ncbi:MAG: hypothetical protein JSS53_08880 [Proteobacteria bacterium]|nr:hypothetical protein [Pseudomonadota bacterium]